MSSNDDKIVVQGTILSVERGGQFRVTIKVGEADKEIQAYPSGRMRTNDIRLVVGDRVDIEMSPYDLERGRVTRRHNAPSNKVASSE